MAVPFGQHFRAVKKKISDQFSRTWRRPDQLEALLTKILTETAAKFCQHFNINPQTLHNPMCQIYCGVSLIDKTKGTALTTMISPTTTVRTGLVTRLILAFFHYGYKATKISKPIKNKKYLIF